MSSFGCPGDNASRITEKQDILLKEPPFGSGTFLDASTLLSACILQGPLRLAIDLLRGSSRSVAPRAGSAFVVNRGREIRVSRC